MGLRRYANRQGSSGVVAYESGPDFIRVAFVDGGVYRYTWARPGARKVERMKQLAEQGRGLASFINRSVRDDDESRET